MKPLVVLSRAIAVLNLLLGRSVIWLIGATVLISAGNAIVRKALDVSSNA